MTGLTPARIERPELTARVAAGIERGSVLLIADAGFGKTSALEAGLETTGTAAAWLRVADADRDPGRLVARLVDRVRAVLPGIGEEHAEGLAGALEPLDVRAVARDLVSELERLLVEPLVIAIDDAEHLDGARSLAIVDELLIAPDVVRVAICSRRSLGVRLAKLRATGRLLELGSGDLAFSPAECADCMRATRSREPESDEVERLFGLTEGWPLGVALAAAAQPGADELPAASREAIFDYLAEEVLAGLDADHRERLCAAAVVDELDPQLERALGLPPSFRGDLISEGMFIRAHEGDAYSIHPLLRAFLRARLTAERPRREVDELRRRAAEALVAAGRAPDAIDLLLDAAAFDRAAELIADRGAALVGTEPETVGRWLGRLPADLAAEPMPTLLAGRLAMGQGEFELAVARCRRAVAELEAQGAPAALVWAARFALTDALIAALDLDGAAAESAGAATAGPDAGPGAVYCALAHAGLLARLGRLAESERALNDALGRDRGRELLEPGLDAFCAHYRELPAGQLDEALESIDAGVRTLEAADMANRLPYALVTKMAIHEARGELEAALETFDAILAAARRSGLAGYVGAGARLAAATILARRGRSEDARAQLDRVDERWSSWAGCDAQLARAVLAAAAGGPAEAVRHGRRALDEAARMPPFDRVRVVAVLTPVLCDAGEPAMAREAVETVLSALAPGESTARTRTALACAFHAEGDQPAAHAALRAALDEAGDQARYVLRSEWPQVQPVLWSALEAEAIEPGQTIAAVAAAFPAGREVGALIEHPRPDVRDAALLAAAASGRPDALARLAEDERDGRRPVTGRRLVQEPPPLRFRTLGRFELRRGSWLADPGAWERKVAERVVRLLVLRVGELVPEDELFEAFWPTKSPAAARRSLQTAISSARGVLDLPWDASRIAAGERAYVLNLHPEDSLDARTFEAAAELALATEGAERITRLETARRTWTGEPLPEERYSDWAAAWRERLSSLFRDVLAALGETHGRRGEHAAAVRAGRALVELDPLDESSQRILISAYAAAGRRGDALRQFLACRRALVEQLGIEPDAETVALHRRVLTGEVA